MRFKTNELTLIGILAAIIAVSGLFKLPGIFPGTEFQLSAPIAVAILGCFGFKRYILAGIVASGITFITGIHTVLNVVTAMSFRIVAGGVAMVIGNGAIGLTAAGPIGTAGARLVLAGITGAEVSALLAAALPGMLYTAVSSYILSVVLRKIIQQTPFKEYLWEEKKVLIGSKSKSYMLK